MDVRGVRMVWAATDAGQKCGGTPRIGSSRVWTVREGLAVFEVRPVHQYDRRWVVLAYQTPETAHKARDGSGYQVTDDRLDLDRVEGLRRVTYSLLAKLKYRRGVTHFALAGSGAVPPPARARTPW